MNGNTNLIRKEQTALEFERLKSESGLWCEAREAKDKLKQYSTQLKAVRLLLDGATDYLQKQLESLDLGMPVGEFYDACQLFDLRVIWLRKVWGFYKDKFDQREDESLKRILEAADEVVWSCHRQIVDQAKVYGADLNAGPAPLPFIEASYSPQSFPSELVPYNLKPSETGFLQDLIGRLPVPLISLPQSCVKAPWWLVYVGHELGHHVQYALLDNQRMLRLFKERVEGVVRSNGGVQKDVEKWGGWSREIFADVFSVLTMGPWAVWAMVEFELKKPEEMLVRREQYPSPVTRLALLAETAAQLSLDGGAALRGIQPARLAEGNAEATRDLSMVPHVVKSALSQLPEKPITLVQLTNFRVDNFRQDGAVPEWAKTLRKQDPKGFAKSSLRAPSQIASATVAAWAEVSTEDDARREEKRRKLADDAIALIIRSREEGTRASLKDAADESAMDLGRELGEQLFQADQRRLGL